MAPHADDMVSVSSLVVPAAAVALTSSVLTPEALRTWQGGAGRPPAAPTPAGAWRPPTGILDGVHSHPVGVVPSRAGTSAAGTSGAGSEAAHSGNVRSDPVPTSGISPPGQAMPRSGWSWPLSPAPRVARLFERPRTAWGAGHRGVDLDATAGQAVRAAAGGRITHVGVVAGRPTVTVTHRSGVRTTYEPVAPAVAIGDVVPAGAVLGTVAAAGSHCEQQPSGGQATCLHFGALRGRTYVDPLALLLGGPVVLLPMR